MMNLQLRQGRNGRTPSVNANPSNEMKSSGNGSQTYNQQQLQYSKSANNLGLKAQSSYLNASLGERGGT
jgi:hypothetical protein